MNIQQHIQYVHNDEFGVKEMIGGVKTAWFNAGYKNYLGYIVINLQKVNIINRFNTLIGKEFDYDQYDFLRTLILKKNVKKLPKINKAVHFKSSLSFGSVPNLNI